MNSLDSVLNDGFQASFWETSGTWFEVQCLEVPCAKLSSGFPSVLYK